MSKPIKNYSLGKVQCAIFQGDYQGKPTYSFKFQKSYQKDNKWENTDFFGATDLRELAGLVNHMLSLQVKVRTPGEQTRQPDAKQADYTDPRFDNAPSGDDVPF